MRISRSRPLLWLGAGALLAALLLPLLGSLERAWLCYRRYAALPGVEAEVLRKLERGSLALRIRSGVHAGEVCTARPASALYEAARRGRTVPVVYSPARSGDCETVATVERSGRVLVRMTGAAGTFALAILGGAAALHRRLARRPVPARP